MKNDIDHENARRFNDNTFGPYYVPPPPRIPRDEEERARMARSKAVGEAARAALRRLADARL